MKSNANQGTKKIKEEITNLLLDIKTFLAQEKKLELEDFEQIKCLLVNVLYGYYKDENIFFKYYKDIEKKVKEEIEYKKAIERYKKCVQTLGD